MKRFAMLAAFALIIGLGGTAMAEPSGNAGGGARPEPAPFQVADPDGDGGGQALREPAPFQTAYPCPTPRRIKRRRSPRDRS